MCGYNDIGYHMKKDKKRKYDLHFLFLSHYHPDRHTSFLPLLKKKVLEKEARKKKRRDKCNVLRG